MKRSGLHAATRYSLLILLLKLRVEGDCARREIDLPDKGRRFCRTVHAIHPAVLPFDAKRSAIANVVQRDDDVLELDVAVTKRAKIPEPPRIPEIHVPAEDSDGAIAVAPPHILHVRVINAVAERPDEPDIVDALISEVGG